MITFKLKSKINVTQNIRNINFTFTRTYHSKGKEVTDSIECQAIGIRTSPPNNVSPMEIDTLMGPRHLLFQTTRKSPSKNI